MTWRSYALVSGAGVLATWFASAPPAAVIAPSATGATTGASGAPAVVAGDIEQQARRLRARLRQDHSGPEPSRNLFRFGARPAAGVSARPVTPIAPPPVIPLPPPFPFTLAGIAADVDGTVGSHRAILSSPGGVIIAAVGESAGEFRVNRVDEVSVELAASDGAVTTLRLSPK